MEIVTVGIYADLVEISKENPIFYVLQKWTMVTLSGIAITLIVGLFLIQYGHGQTTEEQTSEPKGVFKSKAFIVNDLRAVKEGNYYSIQGTITNISNETITGIYMDIATYNAKGNYNGVAVHKVGRR